MVNLAHKLSLLFGSESLTAGDMQELFQLYREQSVSDKIGILARLICLQPIVAVMKRYIVKLSVVVDLGCGYGLLSNFAALSFTAKVYGFDSSYLRIQAAKESTNENIDVHFYHDDILKIRQFKT